MLTFLALSLPGLLLAPLLRTPVYLFVTAVIAAIAVGTLWRHRHAVAGTEVDNRVKFKLLPPDRLLVLAVGIVAYVVLAIVILSPLVFGLHAFGLAAHLLGLAGQPHLGPVVRETARAVALGLISVVVTLPVLVLSCAGTSCATAARTRRRSTIPCSARWSGARTGSCRTTWGRSS